MCVVIGAGNGDGVCRVTLVHVQVVGVNSRWERVGADNLVRCIIAVDVTALSISLGHFDHFLDTGGD